MRINQYIARATGMSRRQADEMVAGGRVMINHISAAAGQQVADGDVVMLDDKALSITADRTIMINKPVGYLVSRTAQGAPTIYELLPPDMAGLKPAGRLDKDSSGLLVMSNNGQVIHKFSHPSKNLWKVYQVTLDRPLKLDHAKQLEKGVSLEDGISRLRIEIQPNHLTVQLQEGRNRQIRRSFAALGYEVKTLHRTAIGNLKLADLASGRYQEIRA
ncbi:MAG TPA: pseudouridine synthase [Candidatus Saccharimonadales bacterium]|nr:pseudouridine synthase [Candidatus Saccharimonadales bacterium]